MRRLAKAFKKKLDKKMNEKEQTSFIEEAGWIDGEDDWENL